MTATIVSTATTTPISMDGDDYLLVTEPGSISISAGDTAPVSITGSDNTVVIFGTLLSEDFPVIRNISGPGGNTFHVGATGLLVNTDDYYVGITIYTDDNVFTNHGTILGLEVYFTGSNSHFSNHGLITGTGEHAGYDYAGLKLGGTGSSLYNAGVIEANFRAVEIEGPAMTTVVVNDGTLVGDAALFSRGDQVMVTNNGTITGRNANAVDMDGTGDMFRNFGTVNGDVTLAGAAAAVINGGDIDGDVNLGDGADLFDGRGGSVTGQVYGGLGDDTYIVSSNDVSLREYSAGGTDLVQSLVSWELGAHFENLDLLGADDLNATGNDEFNLLNGNAGANRIRGHNGDDTVNGGSGEDTIAGGGQADLLNGDAGDDIIWGQAGDDNVSGGNGNDWVAGNAGDDRVVGNDGDDTLIGGQGQDALNGGDGSDVFLYRWAIESPNTPQADKIRGFVQGEDVIDLGGVADGTLDFIGSSAFSGTGPEVRINVYGGTNSRIRIDVDGDGTADMRIDVLGVTGLTAEDFLL